MQKTTQRAKRQLFCYWLLVGLVLVLGGLVQVVQFPNLPPGLNQDEASSAYEAYALATTGCDRWGNHLPAYFPALGSGQNVLLSYLMVPAVKMLGLNLVATRLVPLLLGLLSLPLFFGFLRPLGRRPALLGLLLLALAPWHFMLSRWALESNIVVFWMLLGCVLLARAITTQRRRWIIPALLPFGVALYAYGTTVLVLPTLLLLLAASCWPRIRPRWGAWLLAAGLLLLLAFPFLLFFLENYVLGCNLAWTDNLFFATPLLPATRLSQVAHGTWHEFLGKNVEFALSGFDDGTVYNQLVGYPLLATSGWVLAPVGLVTLLYKWRQVPRPLAASPPTVVGLLTLAWLLGCVPLFFLFELNINRVNHLFLPCLVLAVLGVAAIIDGLRTDAAKRVVWVWVLGGFLVAGFPAVRYYLRSYRHGSIATEFNAGLAPAFGAVARLQGTGQVRITTKMPLYYVYTLYYLRYPPARFQREAQVKVVKGDYQVAKFGRYVFDDHYLTPGRSYGYLTRPGELKDDARHHRTVTYRDEQWEVGIMQVAEAGAPDPVSERLQHNK